MVSREQIREHAEALDRLELLEGALKSATLGEIQAVQLLPLMDKDRVKRIVKMILAEAEAQIDETRRALSLIM